MNEYLFSYGTLQTDKTQLELFGRLIKGTKDTLTGYKVSTIEIKDEVFLRNNEKFQRLAIPSDDKNDFIEGTVLEVSEEELIRADKYEPEDYKRYKVKLESGKESWIYAATAGL